MSAVEQPQWRPWTPAAPTWANPSSGSWRRHPRTDDDAQDQLPPMPGPYQPRECVPLTPARPIHACHLADGGYLLLGHAHGFLSIYHVEGVDAPSIVPVEESRVAQLKWTVEVPTTACICHLLSVTLEGLPLWVCGDAVGTLFFLLPPPPSSSVSSLEAGNATLDRPRVAAVHALGSRITSMRALTDLTGVACVLVGDAHGSVSCWGLFERSWKRACTTSGAEITGLAACALQADGTPGRGDADSKTLYWAVSSRDGLLTLLTGDGQLHHQLQLPHAIESMHAIPEAAGQPATRLLLLLQHADTDTCPTALCIVDGLEACQVVRTFPQRLHTLLPVLVGDGSGDQEVAEGKEDNDEEEEEEGEARSGGPGPGWIGTGEMGGAIWIVGRLAGDAALRISEPPGPMEVDGAATITTPGAMDAATDLLVDVDGPMVVLCDSHTCWLCL